jgi:hypothetical protein
VCYGKSLPKFQEKVASFFRLEESTVKMKAKYCSGILVRIYQTAWRHNPENGAVLYHRFESLRSWVVSALPSLTLSQIQTTHPGHCILNC